VRWVLTVAGPPPGLVTAHAGHTLVGTRCVLTLLPGTSVGVQTLVHVWNQHNETKTTHTSSVHPKSDIDQWLPFYRFIYPKLDLLATRLPLPSRLESQYFTFTCLRTVVGLEAFVTFTFIGAREVHTVAARTTHVLLRALVHICRLHSDQII